MTGSHYSIRKTIRIINEVNASHAKGHVMRAIKTQSLCKKATDNNKASVRLPKQLMTINRADSRYMVAVSVASGEGLAKTYRIDSS